MYLRHSVRRKNGKAHTYWRLVRSVRRGGKVIQETVAHLGELDAEGRAKAQALARQITGRGEQRALFEAPAGVEASAKVRLDRIRLERGRSFGDVWLGWTLWQALRLDALCGERLPEGREAVPWAVMAARAQLPPDSSGIARIAFNSDALPSCRRRDRPMGPACGAKR